MQQYLYYPWSILDLLSWFMLSETSSTIIRLLEESCSSYIALGMLLIITAYTVISGMLLRAFVRLPMQCSVTCGSGEQTRDVTCVDSAGGNRVADYMCTSLPKPPHTQTCEMSGCITRIGWHVGDWGLVRWGDIMALRHSVPIIYLCVYIHMLSSFSRTLSQCSKSCNSGLRERQVICSDSQRNIYEVERCNTYTKPPNVENCNTQPCYSPQGTCLSHTHTHTRTRTHDWLITPIS